jgi:hypothetical protein
MSKVALDLIVERWQLHQLTLEALLYSNGVFAEFESADKHYLVIKAPNLASVGYDFVSISHDCATRTTNVLYHGLADEAGLLTSLQQAPRRCMNPKFLVLVLYRFHQLQSERHRFETDEAIFNTEAATGFGLSR